MAETKNENQTNPWSETKKEVCAPSEKGSETITYSLIQPRYMGLEIKDFLDLLLKSIGIVAIFIPLFILWWQRRTEMENKKLSLQIEVYANSGTEIQNLLTRLPNCTEYNTAKSKLDGELYAKMLLYGDKDINEQFLGLKDDIGIYTMLSLIFNEMDSVNYDYRVIAHSNTYPIPPGYTLAAYKTDSAFLSVYEFDIEQRMNKLQTRLATIKDVNFEQDSAALMPLLKDATAVTENFIDTDMEIHAQLERAFEAHNHYKKTGFLKDNFRNQANEQFDIWNEHYPVLKKVSDSLKDKVALHRTQMVKKFRSFQTIIRKSNKILAVVTDSLNCLVKSYDGLTM